MTASGLRNCQKALKCAWDGCDMAGMLQLFFPDVL